MKKDEQQVNMKAMRFGWLCVTLIILMIGIFRYINNETIADLLLIITTHLTAISWYQYSYTKKTDHLFSAIIGLIALGLSFATLLSEYGIY